ncbi:MAG: hypothetical protein AAF717_16640 [Bacteroidota bacterium]
MKTLVFNKTWLSCCIGLLFLVVLCGCDNDDEGAYSLNEAPQDHTEIVQIEGNQIAMNLV